MCLRRSRRCSRCGIRWVHWLEVHLCMVSGTILCLRAIYRISSAGLYVRYIINIAISATTLTSAYITNIVSHLQHVLVLRGFFSFFTRRTPHSQWSFQPLLLMLISFSLCILELYLPPLRLRYLPTFKCPVTRRPLTRLTLQTHLSTHHPSIQLARQALMLQITLPILDTSASIPGSLLFDLSAIPSPRNCGLSCRVHLGSYTSGKRKDKVAWRVPASQSASCILR